MILYLSLAENQKFYMKRKQSSSKQRTSIWFSARQQ